MNANVCHGELRAIARKWLTSIGFDPSFTEDQLYEIAYLLAHDMMTAMDSGIDKYTDEEWREANRIK